MDIRKVLRFLLSIPKTLYFNFLVLEFKEAIRLPFFISYDIRIKCQKKDSRVCITSDALQCFMIKIGTIGSEEISTKHSLINLEKGTLEFKGFCSIAKGCTIGVSNGGHLVFGNRFSANRNFVISCNSDITFGEDVLLGWNTFFFDANGHKITIDGVESNPYSPIHIGNHVWICSEVQFLKGSEIPDGCVVAYGTLVTKKFNRCNSLIGGSVSKEIKNNVKWEK